MTLSRFMPAGRNIVGLLHAVLCELFNERFTSVTRKPIRYLTRNYKLLSGIKISSSGAHNSISNLEIFVFYMLIAGKKIFPFREKMMGNSKKFTYMWNFGYET